MTNDNFQKSVDNRTMSQLNCAIGNQSPSKNSFPFSRVSIVAHGNLAVIFAREQPMNTAFSTRFPSISQKPWFFQERFLRKNTAHPS